MTAAGTVGIVQTEGIGDVVIALPIARYFLRAGHRVVWPVNESFVPFLREAAPGIEFVGVPAALRSSDAYAYLWSAPSSALERAGCDLVVCLYSRLDLPGVSVVDEALARSLKFDEYKYAVAGVPFSEKWNLDIERNLGRETALFDSLRIDGDYICVHKTGRELNYEVTLPEDWLSRYRIVEIRERTDSPFDWLHTLEGASKLVLIDSCFSNLVEQLGFPNEKYCVLRSTVAFTPVLRNGWQFLAR
ncbi:MAG: hypothetical protein GC151_13540 [Betaproteobacteria bacterium]|nr:hypothetical protein [Betaproteobacteria bacterium]